ncbi:unnamed protein product, partial [marine sediment metagenome]
QPEIKELSYITRKLGIKQKGMDELLKDAQERNLKITIYDSFKSSFDIDIKQDLVLAYEYFKIFNLVETETYKFLKNNLKLTLQKRNKRNNRDFKIIKSN